MKGQTLPYPEETRKESSRSWFMAYIETLRQLLEDANECGDLEDRMALALALGDAEALEESGSEIKWVQCGDCHGGGQQGHEEEERDCPTCFGIGGKWKRK